MGKGGAAVEGVLSDFGHAVRDGHTGQGGAVPECPGPHVGHAVRDGHVGQGGAALEHAVFQVDHIRRDGHACQLGAVCERRIVKGVHTGRDGHAGNIPILVLDKTADLPRPCYSHTPYSIQPCDLLNDLAIIRGHIPQVPGRVKYDPPAVRAGRAPGVGQIAGLSGNICRRQSGQPEHKIGEVGISGTNRAAVIKRVACAAGLGQARVLLLRQPVAAPLHQPIFKCRMIIFNVLRHPLKDGAGLFRLRCFPGCQALRQLDDLPERALLVLLVPWQTDAVGRNNLWPFGRQQGHHLPAGQGGRRVRRKRRGGHEGQDHHHGQEKGQ